ncbi:MAG: hypothetical protein ABEJ74_01195 [Haloferacaceae archaeon]
MRWSLRTLADALAYAGVLTALVALPGAAVGLAFRGDLVAAKRLLFLVGFALLAYGSFQLRPSPPSSGQADPAGRRGSDPTARDEPRGIQALVGRALPATVRPAPADRLPIHAKLVVAALAMLLASLLLEVAFGVGAG